MRPRWYEVAMLPAWGLGALLGLLLPLCAGDALEAMMLDAMREALPWSSPS